MAFDAHSWLKAKKSGTGNSVQFETIGDAVQMEITRIAEPKTFTDERSGRSKDSLPLEGTVINIRGTEANPGDTVTLFVTEGPRATALFEALSAAGTTRLEEGGILTMAFTHEKNTGQRQPLKLYSATYQPPTKGADVTSIFSGLGQTAPATPVPASAPAAPPAQAPAGDLAGLFD